MTDANFSVLDLLDLPPLERELFLCLARGGSADAATLAADTGHDPAAIRAALDGLARKGRLQLRADGSADARMGRIASRTTLPTQLWPALLTTGRLYSEQEVAILRTALPFLQFARARLSEFADHGPTHALRVKSFATQLGSLMGLSRAEQQALRAAALFHDIGNVVDRGRHHIISQETVEQLAAEGSLPLAPKEAEVIALLCRWHRREYDPARVDTVRGEQVRTGLLGSIIRVADAMDIDHRRSDYDRRFRAVIERFFPNQLKYWTSLEQILGVRIRAGADVELQVLTREPAPDNNQIAMLRGDLATTPLDWRVVELAVAAEPPLARDGGGRALLAFPFEPHSLVMAALSRRQLAAAGLEVELLCYPDTPDGPVWLWDEALAGGDPAGYGRLVVIGDRPDEGATPAALRAVERWREAGCAVSVLNRHEGTWGRLPQLRAHGADVTLGGDGAYFWGDAVSKSDVAWGRVAALCSRDTLLPVLGLGAEEEDVSRGLLAAVYAAAQGAPGDTAGWAALAAPLLDRIAADDQAFFAGQAAALAAYATPRALGRVEGRVLRFDGCPAALPQAAYWAMEGAIEGEGRAPARGVRFHVPYAVATWPDGDGIALLAISHWREEEAAPIRLLYPDIGPTPVGTESSVWARLPPEQAELVVGRLVEACNG